MQRSTERRRDALRGAWSATAVNAFSAGALMLLRSWQRTGGILDCVLLVLALAEIGLIIPVWIVYRERRKEIEGGEEDAAAQY